MPMPSCPTFASNVEFAIASLPPELQRIVLMDAMRASLEVKDYAGAARRRSDLDVVGGAPRDVLDL